jgi:hypothetical protein
LISFFEDVLFPDADNLYMFVSDINPNAIRLYTRLGYNQVAALPNFNLESQTEFLHRKSRRPVQAKQAEAALSRELLGYENISSEETAGENGPQK